MVPVMEQYSDGQLVDRFVLQEELGHHAQSQQAAVELIRRTLVALNAFRQSSDRAATWMIRLTVVIAALTTVLSVLTLALVFRGR
jgi:hypothetical protein